jgi:hypothetical protein
VPFFLINRVGCKHCSVKPFFQLFFGNAIKRIKIIVTDGDFQDISQLGNAIIRLFPHAYQIRCSWHIIGRGWDKTVKVALGGKSQKKGALSSMGEPGQKGAPLTELNKTARIIYRWMFPWAQPCLLVLQDRGGIFRIEGSISDICCFETGNGFIGRGVIEAIIKFANKNVFSHEERMAYFKRHGLF